MGQRLRENALCASFAAAGCAAMAWLGLYGFAWNDYEVESKPAFDALTHGHLLTFLRLAPAYGGSLVERAPFALLPELWGGGALAVYRAVAVPCLLAGALLGVWLAARMRTSGGSTFARAVTVALCAANPLTLSALELGHPEELLGACLCVGAVLLACRPSRGWRVTVGAGALLGLAIANKEWALLAAGPVLLAVASHARPSRRRRSTLVCLTTAGAAATLVLAPLLLASSGSFLASARAVSVAPGALFQPWQLWWFFGSHGRLMHAQFGIPLHGYRTGPAWAGAISHPLIVLVGLGLAGILWLVRRRSGHVVSERDALLALALALLLRCVLDTWDIGYYMLPCLLALLAWEVSGASARPPILTLTLVVLPWFVLQEISVHGASPDTQAALFLAWALPLASWLCLRLFLPGRARLAAGGRRDDGARAQETTVSAFGRLVSTS